MQIYSILLAIHIAAGFTSLITAFASAATKVLPVAHRWHVCCGRVFFVGMCLIFATALPMSIMRPNMFLFLISFFSIYMAITGWRFARNRSGKPDRVDFVVAAVMFLVALGMLVRGVIMLNAGESRGWVMIVFGLIGMTLSASDFRIIRSGGLKGKARIAGHVSRMMGGTIATLTAFIVTNFRFDPMVVLWLAPGAIVGPPALWWMWRIKHGKAKFSMR